MSSAPSRRPRSSAARSAGRAQRRRHHVAQRVRPLVLGPLEAQVVRADLGVDGHPAPPRGDDLGQRPGAGDVHHVGRRARDLGQREEAMHALGLEGDRSAAWQRVEAEPALGDELPREQVDRAAVLAVRQHDHPECRRLLHHGQRDVVVGHDPELDVGQPELDAADTELGHIAHVPRAVGERLPDHGVEGEVDERVGHLVGERAPGRLDRALALERVDEGERARGAAEQRRARVVAHAAEGVRVHVHRSRQHEATRRVDDLATGALDLADLGDQAVLDQHVGGDRRLGTDDGAAGDHGATARAHVPAATSASVGAALSSRRVYSCCGSSSTCATGPDSTSDP